MRRDLERLATCRAAATLRARAWLHWLALALLYLAAAPAFAADKFCSDYEGGIIDGNVVGNLTQITIDRDCTLQNFQPPNPLTATINFQTNDDSIYLIIFDNVTYDGNMACANIDHRIWFSNSSSHRIREDCQSLFIPVETIAKENPEGQNTASIGVPFTYTLTLPSMNWPEGDPSANDLHTVTLWDDLTATGADLTYVGINAYYKGSGTPVTLVPEDDPSAFGGVWTPKNLSYKPFPLIYAGDQIVVEMTVVLDDTPNNVPGTTFVNTAKWWFGRLIEGDFYDPLPGEWGVTDPMTIVAPNLVVSKDGPDVLGGLNLGEWGEFAVDVWNDGTGDAWNVTLIDRLPSGSSNEFHGGMCDMVPEVTGVTLAGAPLSLGTDYTRTYNTATCELSLTLLDAGGPIGPNEHLLVSYRTKLDADSENGAMLTNVAGAAQWFNAGGTADARHAFSCEITDGTVGIADCQDAHEVMVALSGQFFEKTVENLTRGEAPPSMAVAGDRLRYTLRLQTTDEGLYNARFFDEIDALNAPRAFEPGTLSVGALPAGATDHSDPGSGVLDIRNLNLEAWSELQIQFEVQLVSSLNDGDEVFNQAALWVGDVPVAVSDDPTINGQANPAIEGDEDPTRVLIYEPMPPTPPLKSVQPSTATIGEEVSYVITVPGSPRNVHLYDVVVADTLDPALAFLSATVRRDGLILSVDTGQSGQTLSWDVGTIPAGQQVEIEVSVRVRNLDEVRAGVIVDNVASYTYVEDGSRISGGSSPSAALRIVEPALTVDKTVAPQSAPLAGDLLTYTLTFDAAGGQDHSAAFDLAIEDVLSLGLRYEPGSTTIGGFSAPDPDLIGGDGVSAAQTLSWSAQSNIDIPAGGQLVLTYQVRVLDSVAPGQLLSNDVTGYWTSLKGPSPHERTGADCPAGLNDYCTTASTSLTVADSVSLSKTIAADSWDSDGSTADDATVRIGDTVTYELGLAVQEGTLYGVAVEDVLPAGMELVSVDAIGSPSGTVFEYTLTSQPAPGATGTLRWEFGDIVNRPSGDGTPIDLLVIGYTARVVEEVGLVHLAQSTLTNIATVSYHAPNGEPMPFDESRMRDSAELTLLQPLIGAISKIDLDGAGRSGTGTQHDPYLITDIVNDTVRFQLEACNDGLAPAYGVVLTDRLARELDETSLSAPLVSIGGSALAPDAYTYSPPAGRGGEMRIELDTPVSVGACVSVDYQIGFHHDTPANQLWHNRAAVEEYGSLPGGTGQPYLAVGPAEVWMSNAFDAVGPSKVLTAPAGGEATIGELVEFTLTVPGEPVNGALNDVVVTDVLAPAFAYVNAVVSLNGTVLPIDAATDGQAVSWLIPFIPSGQQAEIELTVRVANTADAEAGPVTNYAAYTHVVDGTTMTGGSSAPAILEIVEPRVDISKVVAPDAPATAGDVLSYTVALTARSGEGYTDARDLVLVDTLSPGLVYLGGAQIDGATVEPVVTVDDATGAQTLTWAPRDIAAGDTVTVTYDVRVPDDVAFGDELSNTAVARWTSLPGESEHERTGSGEPVWNDYYAEASTTVPVVAPTLVVQKSVVNVSTGQDPGSNARPGDTLRYSIHLQNTSPVALASFALRDEVDHLNDPPVFVAGSLTLVSVPAGADTAATDPHGGAHGTGLLDVRGLRLDPQGGAGDSVTVVFEVTLAPVITSGTVVLNQGEVIAFGERLALTDDPAVAGDEAPTRTVINSAPVFEVWKTSQDISDDPAQLRAGDPLRYTITVQNIGDEDALNAVLRDQLPAYTRYVPNSTTLNGQPVPDASGGVLPLQDGIAIHTPADPRQGVMPADPEATGTYVATITFDVIIDADVFDGTVIANQGFVTGDGAGSGPVPQKPSDDPNTPVLDDPTRDVVGNVPLLAAHKTVELLVDDGSPGIVDPGDVLRYTIAISNRGAAHATEVVFIDAVPANTSYVPDSVRLNGLPVGQPDGGVSPLVAGIPVSSSDLTPPLPGAGQGTISAGGVAVVTFDVQVNAGVPTGTVISNQGLVRSKEQLDEPTDADGNAANGHQPTEIVVGDAQQLAITKEVFVLGGAALPGATLEYVVRATNIGSVPAHDVVITDDLNAPVPGQLSYVAGSATLDGLTAGVSYAAPVLTGDYGATYGPLAPGASTVLRFRAQLDAGLAEGETVTNIAEVAWNSPVQTATASVSIEVGGVPGAASLNGRVWHDANFDAVADDQERALADWRVEVYRNNQLLGSVTTDADGAYRVNGLAPNDAGSPYELRFRAPGAGPNTALLGETHSPFTDGLHRITDIVVGSGSNTQNLNLPITPNGVIYDSVMRTPIAGATVTMLRGGAPLPAACFDDPAQQGQRTPAQGYYKFDINFSDPACPAGGDYTLRVTPPPSGYTAWPSRIIPPTSDESTAAFSLASCLGSADDAVSATPDHCEVQSSEYAPALSIAARTAGTTHHVHLRLSDGQVPGESQAFNNHIAVDPELDTAVTIAKSASLVNVSRGHHVPYTITLRNTLGVSLADLSIVDTFPPGFKYVEGSSRVDGQPVEPTMDGLRLIWSDLDLAPEAQHTIQMLFIVGAAVPEGEHVNRARVVNTRTGESASGEATATVRVVPDPTFDCTDVIGKVFDDANLDGVQNPGEKGLAGVRVVTARGLIAETDEHGRFHITCALTPNETRGSNFILKLDDRSLPSGYRVTTENPRVQRATRGKMMRFNFGATLHRVVRIDVSDAVFEPGSTEMRVQWRPSMDLLLDELRKSPSVVRVSYLADVEQPALVKRRLATLKRELTARWQELECCYPLAVETETFWRRGAPPGR
ncbi:DUF11 domain-containing protein [Ectothiorhodospiraceae bacterium 2226]|nr:DUF11 domain-containing protein [Ectothiorhodospiraceae bacterium 2226]